MRAPSERQKAENSFSLWPPHDDQTMDHKGQSAGINYCPCKQSGMCVCVCAWGRSIIAPERRVSDRGAKIGSLRWDDASAITLKFNRPFDWMYGAMHANIKIAPARAIGPFIENNAARVIQSENKCVIREKQRETHKKAHQMPPTTTLTARRHISVRLLFHPAAYYNNESMSTCRTFAKGAHKLVQETKVHSTLKSLWWRWFYYMVSEHYIYAAKKRV